MTTYTVEKGDSIWKIAKRFQVDFLKIIWANPHIKNPSLIYPGQELVIPNLIVLNSLEQKVFDLTNQFRQTNGLPTLTANWQLSRLARLKAEDMRDQNYAGHISPTYGTPFEMMRAFGIPFKDAAENVAGGQTTPEEAVNALINEPFHRINILDVKYHKIGVGYALGGSFGNYWSQLFTD